MPSISEVPANSTSVWIVSDSFADTEQFRISSLAADLHCSKFVLMKSLDTQLATLLTEMRSDPPSLVWVAVPAKSFVKAGHPKCHTALRVLLEEQISSSRHAIVEDAATSTSQSRLTAAQSRPPDKLDTASRFVCAGRRRRRRK
jgi:hypothetical protein